MRLLFLVALLAACGQGPAPCASIASEYHDAFLAAVACDPSGASRCSEWRPIAMSEGSSTADARITGLCFTGGVGYVTAQRSSALDLILARYGSAGCTVGRCPGFPNNLDQCVQNAAGKFTCGGM
jgi:hypothetical protein